MEKESVQYYWIGGNRFVSDTKFMWHLVDQNEMYYQNWILGEPNNAGGEEECVAILYTTTIYGWNDINHKYIFNFICE